MKTVAYHLICRYNRRKGGNPMVKEVSKGVWYVEARYYDPALKYGTRKRLSGFVGTEKQARRKERELYQDLVKSSLTSTEKKRKKSEAPKKVTFGDGVDMYLAHCGERGLKTANIANRMNLLKKALGGVRIDNPKMFLEAFSAWRQKMITTPTKATKTPLKGSSINFYVIWVKVVLNYAKNIGVIKENPITTARFPSLPQKPRQRLLTEGEETALLDAIKLHRPFIYPLIQYMLLVPSRWASELLYAKLEQFDRQKNLIYIPDSKAGISIYKPIPPVLQPYFDSLSSTHDYIFFERKVSVTMVFNAFKRCCKIAGVVDVTLHTLRHCAITRLVNNKNDPQDVSAVAGWTSTEMLRIYYHTEKIKAARKIQF
jgi:integrase